MFLKELERWRRHGSQPIITTVLLILLYVNQCTWAEVTGHERGRRVKLTDMEHEADVIMKFISNSKWENTCIRCGNCHNMSALHGTRCSYTHNINLKIMHSWVR